jgi:trans-aconitate 2-methyltransferase
VTRKDIWDAKTYLQFEDERLRPALDLIARIPHVAPQLVVDLGCGAGNALPVLAARFPGARVMGVDGSAAMLAKAGAAGFATEQANISTWAPEAPADVIFSNAALQWLDGHEALFPRLLECLAPGGVLFDDLESEHEIARFKQQVLGIGAERYCQLPAFRRHSFGDEAEMIQKVHDFLHSFRTA